MPNLKPINPNDIQVVNNMVAFSSTSTPSTSYFNENFSDYDAVAGYNMISGTTMKFYSAQKVPNNGRPFSNLYHSFKFPLTSADTNSGWVNAGYDGNYMSAITSTRGTGEEFIVMPIPRCDYGELIDGRTIKIVFPTGTTSTAGQPITAYTSYYSAQEFASDNSSFAAYLGHEVNVVNNPNPKYPSTNVAFLFSDAVRTPQVGYASSWAEGFPTTIGASTNGGTAFPPISALPPSNYPNGDPDLYSFTSAANKKPYATADDIPIGVCYLDKGFCVLTYTGITDTFASTFGNISAAEWFSGPPNQMGSGQTGVFFTGTTAGGPNAMSAYCQYYTFEKEWVVNIDCLADSGEFLVTENQTAAPAASPTYGASPVPNSVGPGGYPDLYSLDTANMSAWVTEVGLYDDQDNLIAIGKPDRPVEKAANGAVTFRLIFKF
tara:strand:+ start:6059 stop:7360 length:1302 start_codon:yes stop_codon:yes gene_type:complete